LPENATGERRLIVLDQPASRAVQGANPAPCADVRL